MISSLLKRLLFSEQPSRLPGALRALVLLGLMLCVPPAREGQAATAAGDAVRVSGQWHENLRVRGIERGQLVYVSSRGQTISVALSQLEGLRLARFPELKQGYDDLEAGRLPQAILALRKVGASASDPWLQHLSSALLVRGYDRSGQGAAALTAYLALIRGRCDPALLSRPPVRSTEAMSIEQKIRFLPRIQQARQAATHPTLVSALHQLQVAVQWADSGEPGSGPPIELPTITPLYPALHATATGLLQAGRPAEALAALEPVLAGTEGLDEAIYLQARAQMALAQQLGEEAAWKTAALNFMRVVIHFPRSPYQGPALMEAGYAHEKWGDLLRRNQLYQRAAERLDAQRDPLSAARLKKLLSPTSRDDNTSGS